MINVLIMEQMADHWKINYRRYIRTTTTMTEQINLHFITLYQSYAINDAIYTCVYIYSFCYRSATVLLAEPMTTHFSDIYMSSGPNELLTPHQFIKHIAAHSTNRCWNKACKDTGFLSRKFIAKYVWPYKWSRITTASICSIDYILHWYIVPRWQ